MKRLTIFWVVFILVFSLSVLNLEAENKKNHMFLNFGNMEGFEIRLWTAGINVDFHLEDSLMLTPELIMIFGWRFHFDYLWLAPGLILNTKYKSLFLGAGVTKWFQISNDDDDFPFIFLLKFNVGANVGKLRLAGFAITTFNFSGFLFGATIGLRF